jgi:hypothetical protein
MNISSRHHYIPVFFLDGFTNDYGEFYVFNKKTNILPNKLFRPKSHFFEWDRNTVNIDGEETDFIEGLYSQLDNICAPTFNKLQNPLRQQIEPFDFFNIILFLNVLNWRIPAIDNQLNEYLDRLSPDELKFKILDRKSGKDVPKEVFDKLFKDENFRKAYRSSIGVVKFPIIKNDEVDNWKLYYSTGNSFNVCGDNPLICDNPINIKLTDTTFLIPLTKNIVLVHKKGTRVDTLTPELKMKIDILIYLQSEMFICSSNRDYLDVVTQISRTYDKDRQENLKREILDSI